MLLTTDQKRVLSSASRALSYRDNISVAAAAELIQKQPRLLGDLSKDFAALEASLPVPEPFSPASLDVVEADDPNEGQLSDEDTDTDTDD